MEFQFPFQQDFVGIPIGLKSFTFPSHMGICGFCHGNSHRFPFPRQPWLELRYCYYLFHRFRVLRSISLFLIPFRVRKSLQNFLLLIYFRNRLVETFSLLQISTIKLAWNIIDGLSQTGSNIYCIFLLAGTSLLL